MTKKAEPKPASKPGKVVEGEPVATQPGADSSVLSERSETGDDGSEKADTTGVAFAAIPPKVQLDASDDAEIERRTELRLKRPRQDVQAARERAQSPGFVPAESEASIAFNKLKADVAREVRAEMLKEKTEAGQTLLAKTPPESEPTPTSNPDTK